MVLAIAALLLQLPAVTPSSLSKSLRSLRSRKAPPQGLPTSNPSPIVSPARASTERQLLCYLRAQTATLNQPSRWSLVV